MKKTVIFNLLVSVTAYLIIISGCRKEDAGITPIPLPSVSTSAITPVTTTSVVIKGMVSFNEDAEVTARGICWSTAQKPTLADSKTINGSGFGPFTSNIVGLLPETTYYFRAYVMNSKGITYGNEIEFTTKLIHAATLTTNAITDISALAAVSGGHITANGGVLVTDWGVCWSTNEHPTTDDTRYSMTGGTGGMGSFICNLTGLMPTTTYFVRAYAVNSAGIAYGNELSFTTSEIRPISFNPDLTYGSVSDKEGNTYKTIQIGTQVWMAENLKTTRYQDGTPIPGVTDDTAWKNLTSGGYCWYNYNGLTFKDTYGALYNWYAVADSRKLCPTGWHVPTHAEWNILAKYLGGEGVAGGKMKETGTAHWISPNSGATNESGFTGLPGGSRYYYLKTRYSGLGESGTWWSASATDAEYAVYFTTWSGSSEGYASDDWTALKSSGFSVRCVKDN